MGLKYIPTYYSIVTFKCNIICLNDATNVHEYPKFIYFLHFKDISITAIIMASMLSNRQPN